MSLVDRYYEFHSGKGNSEYSQAQKIVFTLLNDCTGRRGWRQEWDQFDDEIQEEIIETWIEEVNIILNSTL